MKTLFRNTQRPYRSNSIHGTFSQRDECRYCALGTMTVLLFFWVMQFTDFSASITGTSGSRRDLHSLLEKPLYVVGTFPTTVSRRTNVSQEITRSKRASTKSANRSLTVLKCTYCEIWIFNFLKRKLGGHARLPLEKI